MLETDLWTLFELLPIGVYRASMDGKSVRVNAALAHINGFNSVQEMQTTLGDVFANPYRNPGRRAEFMAQLREAGQLENFESELMLRKNGAPIWIRERAHLVRDAQGNALYFEGTVEDITEERQTHASLLQREALLQNVLQTIPDSVWIKDVAGNYLTCNATFANTCGSSVQSIVGHRDEDWLTYTQNTDFSTTDEVVIRHGKPVVFEEFFGQPGNTGAGLHEVVKAPMLDSQGITIGVLGMARNIQQRKHAEMQLRDTTEKLELALMGAELGLWEHDLTLPRGYVMDQSSWSLLGFPEGAGLSAIEWAHLIHPMDEPKARATLQSYLNGETQNFDVEYRAKHADGRWIWLSSRGKVVQSRPDGSPTRLVGTLMDVTARKIAEQQLRAAQTDLQATLNALPDLLFEVTAGGVYCAVHARDVSMLPYPPAYLIGKNIAELFPGSAGSVWTQALDDAQKTGRSNGRQYSLELRTQVFWFELSVVRKPTERDEEQRFIAIARDITERKTVGDAIAHLAFHDALTGLPNRRLLNERLQRAVSSSSRNGQFGAVMFIDLDRFKKLNDTHGHDTGDLLLQEVARRLRECVREIDTVARLGGDEFVVLIQDLTESVEQATTHARAVGQKILDSLNTRYDLKGLIHESTPSLGIGLFTGDTLNCEEILQRADAAMYAAKAAGGNTLCFYNPPVQ